MSAEYQALVAKVGQFVEATGARRRADMHCQKGCDACCHAWLSVGPVEADAVRAGLAQLSGKARERVRARGQHELAREQAAESALAAQAASPAESEPRCAMLEEDGSCAIYEQRPLVCRTQGHALRYPSGFIPEQSLRARVASSRASEASTPAGDVTWCPLNYQSSPPRPEDVLDAERVDQILSVVTLRQVQGDRERALARVGISTLAASKP